MDITFCNATICESLTLYLEVTFLVMDRMIYWQTIHIIAIVENNIIPHFEDACGLNTSIELLIKKSTESMLRIIMDITKNIRLSY
jgi:hypothetical protein